MSASSISSPHRLLIAETALADRVAQDVQAGHDLRERRVGQKLALIQRLMALGLLPVTPEARVLGPEPQPAPVAQRHSGVLTLIVHEPVKALDPDHVVGDLRARQRPALGRSALDLAALELAEEVEHQHPHLGRALAQPRLGDATSGQERPTALPAR